ncbi:MAG TPA: hypothetical protein PK069_02020 [Methanolinea sp.]|nr:hypothetical protein [Methanolinea sp.]HQK55033.1 hypothetical protein [Methanolinea sp.]
MVCEWGDRRECSRLLDATVTSTWPSPLHDKETISQFVRRIGDGPDRNFCSCDWVQADRAGEERTLIVCGGTGPLPGIRRTGMIGYTVIGEFQDPGSRNQGNSPHLTRGLLVAWNPEDCRDHVS